MTHLRGIDLHTHVIPNALPKYQGPRGERLWPCIQHGEGGHGHVMIDGRNFRTFSRSAWDATQRLIDMDSMDIRYQVLSPMPELLSYWFDAEDTRQLAHFVNAYIGEMVALQPKRFVGLGMVPLQDPDRAARELEGLRASGLHGVEIGTNVNGKVIGDPIFEPFFAAAEVLEIPIFVHALRPAGIDRLVGPRGLEQAIAFPGETGLAIASLMTGGTLERHPYLRLAFCHGGGAFALMLPRLTHIWKTVTDVTQSMTLSPLELARRLYYDTLVYDARTLRYLIDTFGAKQLLLGSDYPFTIYERQPMRQLDSLNLPEESRESLVYRNAARFLGLRD